MIASSEVTMLRRLLFSSLLATLLLCPRPAASQVEGSAPFSTAGTSAEEVDRAVAALRAALAGDDRASVAAMVEYPLQAWDGRRSVKIKTAKQLLERFDRIFDSSLRATIAGARSATAFANWQGVMFDDGRIWLRPAEEGGALRIVTINEPAPAAPAAGSPVAP